MSTTGSAGNYLFAVNLEQFKASVFTYLHDEIKPEYQKLAHSGRVLLRWDQMQDLLITGHPHLVSGNCMRYKAGPAEVVDYLFDFDEDVEDKAKRGAWEKLAHRSLYKSTVALIEEVEPAQEWGWQFKELVISFQESADLEQLYQQLYFDDDHDDDDDEGEDFDSLLGLARTFRHGITVEF